MTRYFRTNFYDIWGASHIFIKFEEFYLIAYFTGEDWPSPSPNQIRNENTGSLSIGSSLIENMSSKLNIILTYLFRRFISDRIHDDAVVNRYNAASLQGCQPDEFFIDQ